MTGAGVIIGVTGRVIIEAGARKRRLAQPTGILNGRARCSTSQSTGFHCLTTR